MTKRLGSGHSQSVMGIKDVKDDDDAVDDVGYGGSPIGGASPAYFPGNPPQMSTENGVRLTTYNLHPPWKCRCMQMQCTMNSNAAALW